MATYYSCVPQANLIVLPIHKSCSKSYGCKSFLVKWLSSLGGTGEGVRL